MLPKSAFVTEPFSFRSFQCLCHGNLKIIFSHVVSFYYDNFISFKKCMKYIFAKVKTVGNLETDGNGIRAKFPPFFLCLFEVFFRFRPNESVHHSIATQFRDSQNGKTAKAFYNCMMCANANICNFSWKLNFFAQFSIPDFCPWGKKRKKDKKVKVSSIKKVFFFALKFKWVKNIYLSYKLAHTERGEKFDCESQRRMRGKVSFFLPPLS